MQTQPEEPVEVLLVEDNPGDVLLTREAFRDGRIHARLSVVHDGEQAMRYLRRQHPYESSPRPDLILLDLNLPRKSGQEVLAEIKGDAYFKRIPVIVLSSSQAESDVLRSYDLGANCHVTKPAGLDQYMRVVHSIEEFWLAVAKLPRTN